MDKGMLIQKVKELIAAPSCDAELREIAGEWLDNIGNPNEEEKFNALIGNVKACISSIDGLIGFAGSDAAKKMFGEEKANHMLSHAKEIKSKGAKYCDCPACKACEEILQIIE